MTAVEQVLGNRIRQQVGVEEMQFGFTKGKGSTDTIFIVRQMQEKHLGPGKGKSYILHSIRLR